MSGDQPDPAARARYVPYEGAERVIGALARWAEEPDPPVAILTGEPGTGKTTLLGVFAERVGEQVLATPVRETDAEAIAQRLLDVLGEAGDGAPRAALARALEARTKGPPLLLIVDDADALSIRTEMWLFDLVRRSGGALLLLMAVADARLAAEMAEAFRSDTQVLSIEARMSRLESDAYAHSELARLGAGPTQRSAFDESTLADIHRRSQGLPWRVRQEVAAVLAAVPEPPPPPPPPAPEPAPAPPAVSAAAAPAAPRPPQPTASAGSERDEAGRASDEPRAPGPRPPRMPPPVRVPDEVRLEEARREAAERAAAPGAAPARRPLAGAGPAGAPHPDAPPMPLPFGYGNRARSRRDGLIRWLALPVALAASFVGGFLVSQLLGRMSGPEVVVLRPEPGSAQPQGMPEAAPSAAAPVVPEMGEAPLPSVATAPGAGEFEVEPEPAPVAEADRAARPDAAPSEAPGAEAARASPPQPVAAPEAARPSEVAAAPPGDEAPTSPPQEARAPAPGDEAPAPTRAAAPDPSVSAAAGEAQPPDAATPTDEEPAEGATRLAEPQRDAPAEAAAPRRARRTATAAAPPPAPRPPPPRPVEVRVIAVPGAEISIDGRVVGTAPLDTFELERGLHQVSVRLPDGRVVDRMVDVRGTHYNLRIR